MDNLRKTIKLLFREIAPEKVLEHHIESVLKPNTSWYIPSEKGFHAGLNSQDPLRYSNDELDNLHKLMKGSWLAPMTASGGNPEKHVFNILLHATVREGILKLEGNEPVCAYEHLLRWRDISFDLGEDLFTTAFLAYEDSAYSAVERRDFGWKPVIGTNNRRLRQMLSHGMAENHFHLKGSAPHFEIGWISLMNQVLGRESEIERFQKTEYRLSPVLANEMDFVQASLQSLLLAATYIRMKLYKLVENITELDGSSISELHILNLKQGGRLTRVYTHLVQQKINGLRLAGRIGSHTAICVEWQGFDYALNMSQWIPVARNEKEERDLVDYRGNHALGGERRLLYHMFRGIYAGKAEYLEHINLFHAYLLIKSRFRAEFVQVNNRVGFANFCDYQDRKEYFIQEGSIYEKALLSLAVNATLKDQNIVSLEARVAPKNTAEEQRKSILNSDRLIGDRSFFREQNALKRLKAKKSVQKEPYFFCLHFIKEKDKSKNEHRGIRDRLLPRNHKTRMTVERQAKAFAELRNQLMDGSSRIRAIDAANSENGCRPEVFAQAFRFLRNHRGSTMPEAFGKPPVPQLGITYHVGEDFIDIADGLRAVDEAIRFLQLQQGDRIGHGLALGIAPQHYYDTKGCVLVMPRQDLLDNLMWILAKIREYNISCSLKGYLETCFIEQRGFLYHDNEAVNGYPAEIFHQAWQLRGDDPSIYQRDSDKGILLTSVLTQWDRFRCSDAYIHKGDKRYRKDLYRLNHLYHYSPNVRKRGAEMCEFKIKPSYAALMETIQDRMQLDIARRNIAIEANPSSNFVIGTFKRFADHPIVRFNNRGLEESEERKNPNLFVSINTDDQGVFSTYLENEYALMAIALEKEIDRNGNQKYTQTAIYEWLDSIRKMGIEMSFGL